MACIDVYKRQFLLFVGNGFTRTHLNMDAAFISYRREIIGKNTDNGDLATIETVLDNIDDRLWQHIAIRPNTAKILSLIHI